VTALTHRQKMTAIAGKDGMNPTIPLTDRTYATDPKIADP